MIQSKIEQIWSNCGNKSLYEFINILNQCLGDIECFTLVCSVFGYGEKCGVVDLGTPTPRLPLIVNSTTPQYKVSKEHKLCSS
jgi:hypothetical protein